MLDDGHRNPLAVVVHALSTFPECTIEMQGFVGVLATVTQGTGHATGFHDDGFWRTFYYNHPVSLGHAEHVDSKPSDLPRFVPRTLSVYV